MTIQSFYNVITKQTIQKPFFEAQEHEFQLIDNEEHLITIASEYADTYTEITTQSVICWCRDEIQAGIYSIRRYTTKEHDHAYLTQTMPDELDACVKNYLNEGKFTRSLEQVELLNRLSKKPLKKRKGKHND